MHAFDGQTDRRTDRRTEISSLRPRCIPCSAVKTNAKNMLISTVCHLEFHLKCNLTILWLPQTNYIHIYNFSANWESVAELEWLYYFQFWTLSLIWPEVDFNFQQLRSFRGPTLHRCRPTSFNKVGYARLSYWWFHEFHRSEDEFVASISHDRVDQTVGQT